MKRLALLLTIASACAGGTAGPRYTGTVRVADSRLVQVNPDVKTLVDVDQPVFFVRGSYWLFSDGHWYRSAAPTGTWEYVAKPPVPVLQIDQPYAYVHYKKDNTGKAIETVASGFPQPAEPKRPQPTGDRPPAAVDPSNTNTKLAPAR